MPMSWCELVDAMRERRLEWDGRRPWDPEGRFVALEAQPAEDEPPPCTVDQALRLLPPWQPEQADHVRQPPRRGGATAAVPIRALIVRSGWAV